MSNQLISALIILAVLIADIFTDSLAKRDVLTGKWNVNHTTGLLWRIPGFIAATWIYWPSMILWLAWWPLFDMGVSLLRGMPWHYTGTTSRLDLLQSRYPILKWAKWGGGLISLIVYIIL